MLAIYTISLIQPSFPDRSPLIDRHRSLCERGDLIFRSVRLSFERQEGSDFHSNVKRNGERCDSRNLSPIDNVDSSIHNTGSNLTTEVS